MMKLFGKGWLLVAVALLVVPANAWAEKKPVGHIIAIIGSAEYLPGEGELVAEAQPGQVVPVSLTPWRKVRPKQLVYATDEFRTGRKSRLRILFEDSSLMALGPNSKGRLADDIVAPGPWPERHGLAALVFAGNFPALVHPVVSASARAVPRGGAVLPGGNFGTGQIQGRVSLAVRLSACDHFGMEHCERRADL